MIVVSDTSPITALLQIGRIELLASIYGEVFIPRAVSEELAVVHAALPEFVHVLPVTDTAYRSRLLLELDEGEAEGIVLAKELKADELLMDEKEGRRVAEREGLHVIGLLGVLLDAKLRGMLPSLRDAIEQLEREAHFYIAQELKDTILREAGEQ